ncbi:MAG: hypothetical protein VKI93_02120 [Synechococcus sp.]|nr:hypothetical protein [Synechococcus sp.]
MAKAQLLLVTWGSALLISVALRRWGALRLEPLQAGWPVVMTIVLLPALLMGVWVLLDQRTRAHERGESVDSDQETR